MIKVAYDQDICKELCVTPVSFNDYNKWDKENSRFNVYVLHRSLKAIYVPWFYALNKSLVSDSDKSSIIKSIEDCRVYEKGSDRWDFKGNLRDHQVKAIGCLISAYKNSMGGILSLDCGMGKTVVAIKMIATLQLPTLVLVHKEFLANQWVDRLRAFLPNVRIGRIQGKVIDTDDKDVVIAMLQSVSMKDYDDDVFSNFKHVVVDECHHIAARVFSKAMMKLGNSYKLGLSATPDRLDGLTFVLKWFLGEIVLSLKKDNCNITTVNVYNYKPKENEDIIARNGKVCLPKMINRLLEENERTTILCKIINSIVISDNRRKILVLSDRREHLQSLMTTLNNKYPILTTGLYIGGMKQKDLDLSCNADVLLSTYTMTSEGFDLATLNTLVFASPKANIHQCVGRIHRKIHEIQPLIIDIVDSISIFYGQSKKRMKFYKENDFNVDKSSIDEFDEDPDQDENTDALTNECFI